jgi:hypothetical protein
MIFRAVHWFIKDEYWIIKSAKANNIWKFMLRNVGQNSLIEATGRFHILAISHQPTNELVNPHSFRFWSALQRQHNYRSSVLRFLHDERKSLSRSFACIRGQNRSYYSKHDQHRRGSIEYWHIFFSRTYIYLFLIFRQHCHHLAKVILVLLSSNTVVRK